ncbi:hypothetical protein ACLBKT_09285 [Erythrobacter sp. W302b]|uniref:hypothetical protein n=1 Tax=Erythrobacter sp. W302b TaxID=3389874 RepID=UPI00396B2A54
MPNIYNLPKLTDEADYPSPPRAGEWLESGRLGDLATSLDNNTDAIDIDRLKSLPDPWARPLLFNQALTTKDHIAKAGARAQWRGLLALVALRHFYPQTYLLAVQTVDLTDQRVGNAKFRQVLRALAPVDTLVSGVDWSRIGVLTIRTAGQDVFDVGRPEAIGLMVPNCLFAPARGATNVVMPDIPWMRLGLSDPTNCKDISGEQWVALYQYLVKVAERLLKSDISTMRGGLMVEEIRAFATACREKIQQAGATPFDIKLEGSSDTLPHPFYADLWNAPAATEEAVKGGSECQILLNESNGIAFTPEELKELAKAGGPATKDRKLTGVILLDQDIASRTLGKRAEDVRLFGRYKLGTIDQGGNRIAMQADAEREGFMVITPDQIFTRKLVRLVNEGRVDAHGPKWERFLLPLSPLALFLVPRDRVMQQLAITDRGDRFEVSLTLLLVAPDAQSRAPQHTITRFYDKAGDVVEDSVPDDIIMWPDVDVPRWPWNLMRYSFSSEYEMAPRFAASMKSLSEIITLRANKNRDEAVQLLKSLGSSEDLVFERMERFFQGNVGELRDAQNNLIAHRFRFIDLGDSIGEQHILGEGADYLFFGMQPESGGGLMPAGCMLLPERRVAQGQGTMEVAVDFGTTNTVVYMKSADRIEKMLFQSRVTRPISSRLADEDQFAFDCVAFLPGAEVESPFPTVMHMRSFDVSDHGLSAQLADSVPVAADNIFFMPEVADKFGYAVERQKSGALEFDLKWRPGDENKRRVKRFLRQIVMMCSVEGMARGVSPDRIKWHFSYPQAWNSGQSKNFKESVSNAWKEIMRPMLGTDSPARNDEIIGQYIHFETEGAAAVRFFTHGKGEVGGAAKLMIMFDIGGGTTEIAVYFRGEEIIWRSSFRLAGGDFFTRFLSQNISIFNQFRDGGSSMEDVLRKFGTNSSTNHFVELYISQPNFNDVFAESFPMFSDEPEGIGLLNTATVALAGLCYYSGLALRNLMRKGLINESDVRDLTIAFAGRGSSLFRYLGKANDPDSTMSQIAAMIGDVVHAKADGRENADPSEWELTNLRTRDLFSTLPKHEVAHGMLCGEPNMKSRHALNRDTPLGEKVDLTDGERKIFEADQFVEKLPSGARLNEVGNDEFDRFLNLLAIRTGLHVKLDSKGGLARDEINNKVDREFARALQGLEHADDDETGETLDIEPPFITKLRTLVHLLARNVEERKNIFVVQNREPR